VFEKAVGLNFEEEDRQQESLQKSNAKAFTIKHPNQP
jgi:hypothetical protein